MIITSREEEHLEAAASNIGRISIHNSIPGNTAPIKMPAVQV